MKNKVIKVIVCGVAVLIVVVFFLKANSYNRNKNARKFWVFRPKCRYSVGINRGVYTFITSFDCRKQPLFR